MRHARLSVIVVTLVACTFAVAGCGRELPAEAMIGSSSTAPADRMPAPSLHGTTLDGNQLDVSELRGKVVILNGWASWCAPCREEIPDLVALSDGTDPEDVAVVGINVSDDSESATAFAQELGIHYPSIVDSSGALWATIPGIPPKALPSTVVLDRNGRIAMTVVGKVNSTELSEAVQAIAAETA